MENRNSSGLAGPAVIITLLAALGIGGAMRRSPAPATTPSSAGSAESSASAVSAGANDAYEKNAGYEHGAGFLLERFFGAEVDDAENKKAWAAYHQAEAGKLDFNGSDPRAQYSVRFLIATLPAPISPPLQYQFDSELAALQSAAGTANYSLDSFDLPWTSGGKDSSTRFQLGGGIDIATVTPQEASPVAAGAKKSRHAADGPAADGPAADGPAADGKDQKAPAGGGEKSAKSYSVTPNGEGDNRWKRDSGVLLFRSGTQLLIVFLVGETPTHGINRIAMRDALDQISWLEGWQMAEARRPPSHLLRAVQQFEDANEARGYRRSQIRIIGPTFSGSAPSLRNVLEDWRRAFPAANPSAPKDLSIRIISGTASSVDEHTLSPDHDQGPPRITFNTAQVPDEVLWKQIPRIVDNVDAIPRMVPSSLPLQAPPIALLLENTVYGKGGREQDRTGILKLTFPLHISALRTAYRGNQGKSAAGPDLGHHDLDLPDEAGQQRRDVIPSFSPRAAVYDELMLSNLLVTIRREHIRYVGIVASDVQDLVFLVQQIRVHCPDTIVFTTSADIGFLHSDVNTDLRGMRIFTTYPLFNRAQNWTAPFSGESTRQTFPSDIAHGVYNATLAQLDSPKEMLDYGEPLVAAPRCPVIQIGVVGRDDIWPLGFQVPNLRESHHVLSPTDSDSGKGATDCEVYAPAQTPASSPPPGDVYPRPFELLFFLMNLVFLACAAPAILSRPQLDLLMGRRWWIEALLTEDSGFAGQRSLYLMFASIGMLLAEIVGLGFALLPVVAGFQNTWSAFSALGSLRLMTLGFEILVALVVLASAARAIFQVFKARGLWSAVWWSGVGALPTYFAIWLVARHWVRAASAFTLYAFLRATHLHSGVSPLMTLSFLGVAAFAVFVGNLTRLAMLTDRPLPPIDGHSWTMSGHGSFRGVGRMWTRVVEDLKESDLQLRGAYLVLIVLSIAFLYFGVDKVRPAFSIDGLPFDILFILLGFGVYAMFSLVLLRFALTWIALRHLLRRLYSHPSRYSYKNVQLAPRPSHLDQQKLHLYEARPGLSAIEYELGCVRAIVRIAAQTRQASSATPSSPHSDLADDIDANPLLEITLETAERQLEELWRATDWRASLAARNALYETMAQLASIVTALFEPAWRMSAHTPPLQTVLSSDDDKLTIDGKLRQQAELFVAARVGDFVRHVFPHLINLVGFAMPAVLAMVLAISAYPFPAHDTLLWVSWTALLATVAISLYVFVSINRNPIISMFSGTDPGQFNWDSTFTMHLMLFAVIPILTLLGAQYPQALAGTFSWIGSVFGGGAGG